MDFSIDLAAAAALILAVTGLATALTKLVKAVKS